MPEATLQKRVKSKRGLLKVYDKSSDPIRDFFRHLPALIQGFPMDVALAYAFARLELGQNLALYCGVVKLHKANAELARAAVGTQHMTREGFLTLFSTVFGFEVPKAASQALKLAEDTRDAVMHGKATTDDRIRNAVASVLEYAEVLNGDLSRRCGFTPFGQLKGFAGRSKKLDKRTTRFVLKGIGFSLA
jgi:hypothetical protein